MTRQDVYVHFGDAVDAPTEVGILLHRFHLLEQKLDALMALNQQTLDMLKRVDDASNAIATATTAVAAKLDALAAQLNAGEPAAEVAAAIALEADKLEAASATLTALGADPNDPIPTP